ncbi:MurT ligase domain-containing protein [Paraconexibacter sp. AEG42_29]|uniref:MurT ligase domain-containing protein n=1 Tax=Paraconexibacter sp. AEG42_29 TaxID=2997339 RepID=UPI00339D9B66
MARAAGRASRLSGRGGTSIPGKVLLKLDPDAIGTLSAGLERRAAISATNGKTTTAAMAHAILARGGAQLVHNSAGANMAGGIASTLLYQRGDTGLFEIDEFWLPGIVPRLKPQALLLGNLFRDQLDRYGELETIADRWAAMVAGADPTTTLVLNADDPLVADLGRERVAPDQRATIASAAGAPGVLTYGVQDTALRLEGLQHASDSTHCRRCGAPLRYDAVFLGHQGHYHCDACGITRPRPDVFATDVVLDGVRGARFVLTTPAGTAPVTLPLPGLYNVYNALAAAALTHALGAPLADVVAGLKDVAPAFGRAETVTIAGRELSILLVKNPAGANEVLRTLALEDGVHDLFAVLNDNIADGRDVSWIWDADFELLAPHVRRATCAGTRAAEMGLRLKYAGVPPEQITVVDAGLAAGLDSALTAGDGRLFALPTYTAMLALREELTRRGVTGSSFG